MRRQLTRSRVGGFACLACSLIGAAFALHAPGPHAQADTQAAEAAFKRFWDARDPRTAATIVGDIVNSGISFDDAFARLKRGRSHSAEVRRGLTRLTHRTSDGLEHHYAIVVPDTYDSRRPYQVRVQLHGGILRPSGQPGREGIDRLPGSADEISVYPSGWRQAVWWRRNQIENLLAILDELKRTYNVDENRVYLTGISDGGTGVYFVAFRVTTPWASFLPLNGHMMVLPNATVKADGELYPGNATNKPFFIVNGGRDRLYPTANVEPYINHLRKIGVQVVYRPQPEAEHNTNWWPVERDNFERFVREHPRDPLPDRLSWEAEVTDYYNRAHWLIIDRLGSVDGEADLADTNLRDRGVQLDFGLRVDLNVDRGTKLTEVVKRSNAEAIGLRKEDLIISIDGQPIESASDLVEMIETRGKDRRVEFVIHRAGHPQTLVGIFSPARVPTPPEQLFPRRQPSGRVDVVHSGNTIHASTKGVQTFTLLLSPDTLDFSKPVKVVTNGRVSFDGKLERNVATLLKWAARDNDRTMLFGTELKIEVGKSGQ